MILASLVGFIFAASTSQVETIVTQSAIIATSVAGLIMALRQQNKKKQTVKARKPAPLPSGGRNVHKGVIDAGAESE